MRFSTLIVFATALVGFAIAAPTQEGASSTATMTVFGGDEKPTPSSIPVPSLAPVDLSNLTALANLSAIAALGDIGPVMIEIGSTKMNAGSWSTFNLWYGVWDALRALCPFKDNRNACHRWYQTRFFMVDVERQKDAWTFIEQEKLVVSVGPNYFGGNEAIHDLLLEAVAGIASRAAVPPENCYTFQDDNKGAITHCNTVDYVGIKIPNGDKRPLEMGIHLKSSSKYGSVNCEAARSPAETYIDNTIMDKIRHEMRFEYYPQDMYVWSKCL